MKTIQQRAIAYTAMREDPFTWREYQLMQDAYHASATSILDELRNVLSVSEDEYLRTNLEKMIDLLEDREREEMYKQHFEDFFKHKK